MRQRALMAMMDATVVDAERGKWFTNTALAKGIKDVLSTQHDDGSFGGTNYLGGQKNFMVGLLLTALVRYHEEFDADPKIVTAVQRACDYMWDTQWVAAKQGFKYVSVDSTSEGIGQTKPQPSLAALSIPSFSFVAAQTGDPKYLRAIADMEAGVRTNRVNWSTWVEQFDQAYYRIFNHIARMQGVAARR
jgi:hypothetical protein